MSLTPKEFVNWLEDYLDASLEHRFELQEEDIRDKIMDIKWNDCDKLESNPYGKS